MDDPSGILGVDWTSSSFKAEGESAKVIIPKVTLKLSKSTMTLKHDNLCSLEVETKPDNVHFAEEKVEIRWSDDGTWYTLHNGEDLDWVTKVAGRFKLRASARAASLFDIESSEKSTTVQFPEYGDIVSDLDVRERMFVAWQNTMNSTTPTSRREEGYYITLDTASDSYGETAYSIGTPASNGTSYVAWDTAEVPRPDDSILTPAPLDEPIYVVAWFHTHPSAEYLTFGRPVGVSQGDLDFSVHSSIALPGVAYDYLDAPQGSGGITNGHPTFSPARPYRATPPDRRATP